jgi:hypothetical protein
MINAKASNWVDRGEPPEPTLARVLASYLELDPAANEGRLGEYAGAVRGMAEADATEVNIAGYLRTLESTHLVAEHPARHRRATAIALWHIVKAAEVRDRALRLIAEHATSPSTAPVPLSTWLA